MEQQNSTTYSLTGNEKDLELENITPEWKRMKAKLHVLLTKIILNLVQISDL